MELVKREREKRKKRKILPRSSIFDETSDLKEERIRNGQLDRQIIGSFEIHLLLSREVSIFIV